ncbi:eCIS core domain-containing protein [Flavitalea flava]
MPEQTTISLKNQTTPAAAASAGLSVRRISSAETAQGESIYKDCLQRLPLHRKLSVGAANDPMEHEADAMADQIMRMPSHSLTDVPFLQRKCAHCEEEDLQARRKPLSGGNTTFIQASRNQASDSVTSRIQSSRGSGEGMPDTTKSFMESRFSTDFSNVRLHMGGEAAQLSEELNAKAFTVGNDIYFNEGNFSPGSFEGKHLLAHELTHVVQQNGNQFYQKQEGEIANHGDLIQKQDAGPEPAPAPAPAPVPAPPDDSETKLGKKLIADFKDGVSMAFFTDNDEMIRKSDEWAKMQNAVAIKGAVTKVETIVFGKAMQDNDNIGDTVKNIGAVLQKAVEKANAATPATAGSTSGPAAAPATKPYLIKFLALFAHGTEDWCSINSITGKAPATIKAIAPFLRQDANLIIYACSVGNSPSATHDDWDKGTMDSGGKDSVGDKVRNLLLSNGVTEGRVWGHTTVGHVTDNFALRVFDAKDGKDALGKSYVGEYVFTPYEVYQVKVDVKKTLTDDGFDISTLDDADLQSYLFKNLRSLFYGGYAAANKNLKYNGISLAEAAPLNPVGVAKTITDYWDATYWPAKKTDFIKKIITKFKLKKLAPATP